MERTSAAVSNRLLRKSVFKELGLSTTEAINLFFRQVKLRKGLPFNIVIPNKTTEQVFKDTDVMHNLIRCDDASDMYDIKTMSRLQ